MPIQFDEDTRDKIVLLRGLRALGTAIQVYELVKIEWPEPDGTIYYASLPLDEIANLPVSPLVVRKIPDDPGRPFLDVEFDSSIGDEEIEMKFWDQDDLISNLVNDHGEGLRVTPLYWFPQVELLVPQWEGHLRFEDEADADTITLKAAQGFRASEADVPGRAHYPHCQAIFGGVLTTQEEIDEQGCNYNRGIGGGIGTLDPDTGLPWTFCPRRELNDCVVRGISPLRHLSHKTMVTTTANNQTSGPRLLSTSIGNETNLTEPVRVQMGTRRVYDMKVMVYRRDLNNNTPDHGWFAAFYEGGEGPIGSATQFRITVGGVTQLVTGPNGPNGFGVRYGNFGDATPDASLTAHGYSATWFFRHIFGWVDPSSINPEDASASAMTTGLRDIRVFRSVSEDDPGLTATYFINDDFTGEYGTQVISSVNYPFSIAPAPLPNMPSTPQTGFSIRIAGKITFPFSEVFTLSGQFDDGMKVTVDGDVIFDSVFPPDNDSGTFTAVEDTPYDFEVEFYQVANAGANPWYCILRWQSASQSLEVVPATAFTIGVTGETDVKQTSRNRVWQIGRVLTDKRWGHGEDYAKFNIASWSEAASWVEDYVRFTDANGTNWDHQRGMSDVDLIGRKVQQQIDDMCLAGRLSRPFLFDGELHIMPLRALTDDELAACPEFTDEGDAPNIIKEEIEDGVFKSTLKFSRKSDLDLPNRIECTADLATEDYLKTPLQPVEDIDLQLRAGRVLGDKQRKINKKSYHLLGVTDEAQAMKLAWSLLDLGEHDEGGLRNNGRVTFDIWFVDAIDLHKCKVIKVTSSRIAKYGFTHYRILDLKKHADLHYTVEAQAYNHEYLLSLETDLETIVVPSTPPDPPAPQCILVFGDVTYDGTVLDIPVPACVVEDPFTLTDLAVALTDGGIELTDGA